MPSSPPHVGLDQEQDSPGSSSFNTPISSPSGHHTPVAGYRTATATLSNVFASLWGTYSQQQQQQQHESGPSRLQPPPTLNRTPHHSPTPSIPGGWGNLLSWGPAAARQKTNNLRKSASPTRASPAKVGRSRAAIPFGPLAPLETTSAEKVQSDPSGSTLASEQPQRRDRTVSTGSGLSPTTSPRRRPLAGIFEDLPGSAEPLSSASPPHTPAPRSPSWSRSRELPPTSPSFKDESPSGAYATLSRLQSKPSVSKLRPSSGFLWPSSTTTTSADPNPSSPTHSRPAANWTEAIARIEKLDSYVRRIVFQAGLDYETRPMVVLAACCLPDPSEVDYDALLDRIMDTLDLFVENDYTVVYFAAGGHHRPGWSWIWRAYRRLDRRFRKNLKKLYIVHPTLFTKSLMRVVTTGSYIVSPKFSKKVSQLDTLSKLAECVPLTQIDIPPEVLQYNAKWEEHVTLPAKPSDADAATSQGGTEKVFGVDLVMLMGEFGESGGVPRVVRDCVEAILGDFDGIRPVEVEGIFRRSPSSALLKTAQESYDRGHPVSLEQYRDPHMPAVLLKVFLRSLPRPIFPASLYALIRACPAPPLGSDQETQALETIDYLRTRLLPSIEPACSGMLLSYVLELLHKVSQHQETNKMDAANLATVIAPNLVSSGNAMKDVLMCRVEGLASMASGTPSASVQSSPRGSPTMRKLCISDTAQGGTTLGSILRFCIERYYEIFDEMSFGTQLNRVQELVDDIDLAEGSRSPSVASRRLGSLYDMPSASGLGLAMQRSADSVNSELGQGQGQGQGQAASLWGGNMDEEVDGDRRSVTTGRSIASRDGYRAPMGFARGTIARNSSGSLRLTKGRLGSSTNLRSGFTRVQTCVGRPTASLGLNVSAGALDTDGLTSQRSGVALTGANATGRFSSASSLSASPLLASSSHAQQLPASPSLAPLASSKQRRDLSEVQESLLD